MDYVQHKADTHFEIKLDNKEYDEAELIEIRVPVTLPYQTDWKEFERVSGEININGMHYKYVERKLEAGEMIYKCIPDTDKAKLLNARENFFKLVNDLQTQPDKKSNSQPTHSYKTFSFDYCDKLTNWKFHALELPINRSVYTRNEAVAYNGDPRTCTTARCIINSSEKILSVHIN